MKRLVATILATVLSATGACAIVGGAEDRGPLSRTTVMVLSSNGGVCSAVVVGRDVVLTAAHCVTGAAEHRVHFRDEAGSPMLIAPAAKAVHPGYDAKAIETRRRSIDLALVRIPEALPARFERALLGTAHPRKDETVTVGGYGLAREGEAKTTGTFRIANLKVVEPYGPSQILLWSQGTGAMGACQGDSGGPMASDGAVVAITSWSSAAKGRGCGGMTQGILLGPQRPWIDRTLEGWNRAAQWNE
ncbi:S1 family peptidase [Microvirga sp. 2TAF3]|uniref:S1 family peptidase n=1 Tax=Microvirga sp. 2TAF3 TaxID=3233014 RepID=UPI003F9A7980